MEIESVPNSCTKSGTNSCINKKMTEELSILNACDEISNDTTLNTVCRASVRNMIKIFQGIYNGKNKLDEDFKLFTCLFIGAQHPKLFGSDFIKNEITTKYNGYFMTDFAVWIQQLLGFPRLSEVNLADIKNIKTPEESLQRIKNYLIASAKCTNKCELVPVLEEMINKLLSFKDECLFKIFELYEIARIFETKCIKKLRNSRMVEIGSKVITTEWLNTHLPPSKEKKFSSHYNPMHRNKILCSIDLKQANFTALQFINKELGLKNEDLFGDSKFTKQNLYWNDFVNELTSDKIFLSSKLLRESCVSKFAKDSIQKNSPKMNTVLSKPIETVKKHHCKRIKIDKGVTYITVINRAQDRIMDIIRWCINNMLSETRLMKNIDVIYRGYDEIVFSISIDESQLYKVNDEITNILHKLLPKDYEWLIDYMHINTYKLRCLSLSDKSVFYVKEFYSSEKKEDNYEYKMVDLKNRDEACRTYIEFKNRINKQ